MAAEGLPVGAAPAAALPSWELEAWYQDLQEVLAAAESSEPSLPWGAEQAPLWSTEGAGHSPEGCELDVALAAELLELLGPESTSSTEAAAAAASLPSSASSNNTSPPGLGTEEDKAKTAPGRGGVKRKRCSPMAASRELAKQRERANEQRVLELMSHNEQLREEIRRLSTEVEHTRAALIDRILNLRRP